MIAHLRSFGLYRLQILLVFLVTLVAQHAWAAGPGKIAYASGGRIKLMNADGADPLELTGSDCLLRDPALSADGAWIACIGTKLLPGEDPQSGIWVMKAEPLSATNVLTRVSTHAAFGRRLSWHPDGRWLSYTNETVSPFRIELLSVLNANGEITPASTQNAPVPVTTNQFNHSYDGAFSPDGDYLAYSDGVHLQLLRVFDAGGQPLPESLSNQAQQLTAPGGANVPQCTDPSWDNTGTKLVFQELQHDVNFSPTSVLAVLTVRDDLGALTPETVTNPRAVYTPPAVGQAELSPSWSPDGAYIAFNGPTMTEPPFAPNVLRINASEPQGANNPALQLTQGSDNGGIYPSFAQPGGTLPEPPSAAPVPANIVAWYPGDFGAVEIIGGQHTQLNNNIVYAPGKVGAGFRFDGDADYAIVAPSAALDITGNITIEAWINPETVGGGARAIVSKKSNDTAPTTFFFHLQDDGTLAFSARREDGSNFLVASTGTIPPNTFTHVAATMRGNTVTLYINGAESGSGTTDLLRPATGGQMVIGGRRTQLNPQNMLDSYFHGVIDELAIYNRALSTEEIAGIHGAGALGKKRGDAARDFIAATNEPFTQAWIYGTLEASITPNLATFQLFADAFTDGDLKGWDNSGAETPFIVKNTGTAASGIFAPAQLSLVPGPHADGQGSKFAVARWTATEAGTYAVASDFTSVRSGAESASSDYSIWHKGQLLGSGTVFGFFADMAPTSHPFHQLVEIQAGEAVDFLVGASQSTGNDETGLLASLVKVPEAQPVLEDPDNLDIDFTGVPMAGKKWTFRARQGDTDEHVGRISMKVQYSATPNDPGSWVDLPGGAMQKGTSRIWRLDFTGNLPVGDYAFRVVTEVAGVGLRFSEASEVFDILAPAPHLELVASVSALSDESGATTHRGDLLTFTFKYRNSGTLPANDAVLETFLPPGLKVKTKSKGALTRVDRSFAPTIYHYLYWKVGTLAPSEEFSEVSYTALVIEPSKKDDANVNTVGSAIAAFSSLKSGTLQAQNGFTGTMIVSPLVVEATASENDPDQGEIVTFDITVRNKASYTAKKVEIHAIAPEGMFLPLIGDAMQFMNGSQPSGAPIDPATKKAAKFRSGFNPQRDDTGTEANQHRQVAKFYVGSMAPGGVQKARVRFQVQYAYNNHQNLDGVPIIRAEDLSALSYSPAAKLVAGKAPHLDFFIQRDIDHPRPIINFSMSQIGASHYIKPGATAAENIRIATATEKPAVIPGSVPTRKSNEITYYVALSNTGNRDADFHSILLSVPEHTTYKPNSVLVNGEKPPQRVEIGSLGDNTVVGVELPSMAPDSVHTLQYTVIVKRKTPTGTIIEQGGSLISAREFNYPFFGFLPALTSLKAEVVPPATMEYEVLGEEVTPAKTNVTQLISYRNTGGLPATGVGIRYKIPAGLVFKSASWVDLEPVSAAVSNGRSITAPDANGVITFNVGTVPKATLVKGVLKPGGGFARVLLGPDPANVQRAAVGGVENVPGERTADGSFRIDAQIQTYDDSTTDPGLFALRTLRQMSGIISTLEISSYTKLILANAYHDPTLAKIFAYMSAPASMLPTDEITYTVMWGNLSDVTAGVGGIIIPLPEGTEYVANSATTAISTAGESDNEPAIYRAPGEVAGYPNGFVSWITDAGPHTAKIGTFRVRLKAGTFGKVVAKGGRLGLDQSGVRYLGDVTTQILAPGESFDAQQAQIYSSSLGNTATSYSLGNPLFFNQFTTAAKAISTSSLNISIAGADFAKLESNGVIAISLGGGKMVAAGAGNLIGADGASIVAAGGGNIVAAGAGNLVTINTGASVLNGPSFIANIPQMVAAGGLNLVAAGGGNIVAAGAGNLIGADGATLIGMDGATLIGMDGASLGTFRVGAGGSQFFPTGGGAAFNMGGLPANMVAAGGLNLVAAGGGNMVAAGGLNMVAAGAGNLIGQNGNGIVAAGGLNLTQHAVGQLVAAGAGNLVSNQSNGIVAAGGGNLVNGSNGIVAAGAGN